MQLTFGDAESQGERKKARRQIFLDEMGHVVPWKRLLSLIDPHYPTAGRQGRQPYPLATMLRIHLLLPWYALSDPGMEEALHVRAVQFLDGAPAVVAGVGVATLGGSRNAKREPKRSVMRL